MVLAGEREKYSSMGIRREIKIIKRAFQKKKKNKKSMSKKNNKNNKKRDI
jgi:hypothetical protein